MKANELRIGNYVKPGRARYGESYLVVESITQDSINKEFREYNINDIQPIHLTEEWLLKFGFEKSNEKAFNKFDEYIFIDLIKLQPYPQYKIRDGGSSLTIFKIDACDNMWNFVAEIKYVHQLQNLYYALTGEELTYE